MAQMAIGYNINEAKSLIESLKTAHSSIERQIVNNWSALITNIQKEWIGEDEQSFEEKLASRISTLYTNSAQLVDNCGTTIANLAQAWYEFQQKNVLVTEGAPSSAASKTVIEYTKIDPKVDVVSKKEVSFTESTDRGLANQNSAATIKTSVSTYVSGVKNAVDGLFNKITSSKAFFGTQNDSIDKYIQQLSTTVQEVITAVKDMYDEIDKLANSNYTSTVTEVSTFTDGEKSTLETTVSQDLGNSRWTDQ